MKGRLCINVNQFGAISRVVLITTLQVTDMIDQFTQLMLGQARNIFHIKFWHKLWERPIDTCRSYWLDGYWGLKTNRESQLGSMYNSNRCMGVYWLRCVNENSHHLGVLACCNKMMMLPIGVIRHATILSTGYYFNCIISSDNMVLDYGKWMSM